MYIDDAKYREIVDVFRAQESRRRPNISAASKILGLDFRTLSKGWERGWPPSRKRPALPPVKAHFEPQPEPGPVGGTPAGTPAGTPPASGTESAPAGVPTLLGSTPAPAPAPVAPGGDVLAVESAALASNRSVVKGILATATPMLRLLHEGTPKMKAALETLITEQPAAAIRLLGELAKTIEISVKASERLIQAQRVLDGTPSQIHRVEHVEAPRPRLSDGELEAEVRRVKETIDRLTRDDEAIDVEAAAPAPLHAAEEGTIQ